MPKDITKKIFDASMTVLQGSDTIKKFEENGALAVGSTPEQFTATVKREVVKRKCVVDAKMMSLEL